MDNGIQHQNSDFTKSPFLDWKSLWRDFFYFVLKMLIKPTKQNRTTDPWQDTVSYIIGVCIFSYSTDSVKLENCTERCGRGRTHCRCCCRFYTIRYQQNSWHTGSLNSDTRSAEKGLHLLFVQWPARKKVLMHLQKVSFRPSQLAMTWINTFS